MSPPAWVAIDVEHRAPAVQTHTIPQLILRKQIILIVLNAMVVCTRGQLFESKKRLATVDNGRVLPNPVNDRERKKT